MRTVANITLIARTALDNSKQLRASSTVTFLRPDAIEASHLFSPLRHVFVIVECAMERAWQPRGAVATCCCV